MMDVLKTFSMLLVYAGLPVTFVMAAWCFLDAHQGVGALSPRTNVLFGAFNLLTFVLLVDSVARGRVRS